MLAAVMLVIGDSIARGDRVLDRIPKREAWRPLLARNGFEIALAVALRFCPVVRLTFGDRAVEFRRVLREVEPP